MKVYVTSKYDRKLLAERYDYPHRIEIEEIPDELLAKHNIIGVRGPSFFVDDTKEYLCVKRRLYDGSRQGIDTLLMLISRFEYKYLLCIEAWESALTSTYYMEGASR